MYICKIYHFAATGGGEAPFSTKGRFMSRPFQGPPPLQRGLTVPFIPKENPFSLTKPRPQCMATVLSDLHLLSDAVSRAGITVRDAGVVADPLDHLAAFLTDSYKHLKSYWDDACSDNENTRGLEDIVVKVQTNTHTHTLWSDLLPCCCCIQVLLEQMAVTARTLEEQCRHISDHASHVARQARNLDEKHQGINKVVEKATSSIQLEKVIQSDGCLYYVHASTRIFKSWQFIFINRADRQLHFTYCRLWSAVS